MEACFFILHQDRKNVSLNAYHGFEAPADQAGQRLVSFFLHIKNFYVLAAVQQCLRQFVGKKIQNMETYVGTPIDQDRERIVINRIIFRLWEIIASSHAGAFMDAGNCDASWRRVSITGLKKPEERSSCWYLPAI